MNRPRLFPAFPDEVRGRDCIRHPGLPTIPEQAGSAEGYVGMVPKVAIVGRPNVGKSSLLNWLARKRISVVDPMAGVTRDRVTYVMAHGGRYFELVDTGGIGIVDVDDLSADVERQIQRAIDEADLVLFVVDVHSRGPAPLDAAVADRLRALAAPKLLVVNKCDSDRLDVEANAYLRLIDLPVLPVSVKANRGRDALLDAVAAHLPPAAPNEAAEGQELLAQPELKLAIVGRRNVGKSTFINTLARTERMIVSEIPGTTRDSVDIRFELDGKSIVAIDTPGVRKRKSLENDVEFYGLTRAQRSIRRADVVFMFFDAVEPVSRVDKQLVGEILDEYKPCVLVVNKWDLARGRAIENRKWVDYLGKLFPAAKHLPIAFITAQQDRNTKQLVNLAQAIFKQARTRIPTAELNRVIQEAILRNPPSTPTGKRLKIYFATQVDVAPPTIVLKVNLPEQLDPSWQRYLLNVLREQTPLKEVPIKLIVRQRVSAGAPAALDELAADELPGDEA